MAVASLDGSRFLVIHRMVENAGNSSRTAAKYRILSRFLLSIPIRELGSPTATEGMRDAEAPIVNRIERNLEFLAPIEPTRFDRAPDAIGQRESH
jgi:hypothetical protein